MPTHGSSPWRAEKPLPATGKREVALHPLPPPAKRTCGKAGVPHRLCLPGCSFSPAGRTLRHAEQQPLPWKLCPRMGQSLRHEHSPPEGLIFWQKSRLLSQRQPGPQRSLITSPRSMSLRERSHTTLSTHLWVLVLPASETC